MSTSLSQKHLIKGSRSFELVDDAVNVKIDMPFLKEEFTVVLAILDPEPVETKGNLAFVSVVNREPLIEMFIDKPTPEEFEAFVEKVKAGVRKEDYGKPTANDAERNVDVSQLQMSIDMVSTYLVGDEYEDFLVAMKDLKESPTDTVKLETLYKAFDSLGPMQGAVLTYAPYVGVLLTGDIPDAGPPE